MREQLRNAIRVLERGGWYPADWLTFEEIIFLKSEYGEKLHKTNTMTMSGPRGMLYVCW